MNSLHVSYGQNNSTTVLTDTQWSLILLSHKYYLINNDNKILF